MVGTSALTFVDRIFGAPFEFLTTRRTPKMALDRLLFYFFGTHHCCIHCYRPMVHWNRCRCHRDDANGAADGGDGDDSTPNCDANDVSDCCCCCCCYLRRRSDPVDSVAMAIARSQLDRVPNAMLCPHYRRRHPECRWSWNGNVTVAQPLSHVVSVRSCHQQCCRSWSIVRPNY